MSTAYLETVKVAVPAVLRETRVNTEDVVGQGADFTDCTMMPIDKVGTPLCALYEVRMARQPLRLGQGLEAPRGPA